MKKLLLMAIAILCVSSTLWAADSTYTYAIGPYIMLKGGTNAGTIPNGTKTGFAFNGIPDFGVTGFLPFQKGSNVGVSLDLGYSTYALLSEPNSGADDDNTFVSKISYFTITPTLDASYFTLGIAFGIPLSANSENNSGSISNTLQTDSLATIVEIRLGAMVPLISSSIGRLDLNVQAGYVISGMDKSSSDNYNPHAASIALGLNYLFALSH